MRETMKKAISTSLNVLNAFVLAVILFLIGAPTLPYFTIVNAWRAATDAAPLPLIEVIYYLDSHPVIEYGLLFVLAAGAYFCVRRFPRRAVYGWVLCAGGGVGLLFCLFLWAASRADAEFVNAAMELRGGENIPPYENYKWLILFLPFCLIFGIIGLFLVFWGKRRALAAVLGVCLVGAFAYGAHWWERERMDFGCLAPTNGANFDARLGYLMRHSPGGRCAPADKQKQWALIERAAGEWEWGLADYYLAIRRAYGDYEFDELRLRHDAIYDDAEFYYRQNPYDVEENEKIYYEMRDDIGDGRGVDYAKSFELLERGAENGLLLAQVDLSYAYYTGKWGKDGKVKRDVRKSTELLADVAMKDTHCRNAFYAGYRYRYGVGEELPPDARMAYRLLKRSVENIRADFPEVPCLTAMIELARMYADGVGVERDAEAAVKLAERSLRLVADDRYGGEVREYVENNARRIAADFPDLERGDK